MQGDSEARDAALVALPYSEYAPQASLMDDMRTLSVMWFGSIAGDTHQDRLESFYKNQAELYDGYRARMLHARKPMMTRLMVLCLPPRLVCVLMLSRRPPHALAAPTS